MRKLAQMAKTSPKCENSPKMRKLAQNAKTRPNCEKFAQSGHPGQAGLGNESANDFKGLFEAATLFYDFGRFNRMRVSLPFFLPKKTVFSGGSIPKNT
jgi:hypothetical protein